MVWFRITLNDSQLKNEYEGVKLELDLSAEVDTASVLVSPEWFELLLDLVLDNAVEAVKSQSMPRVRIHSYKAASHIEIAIEDNGPGIPADILRSLFREPISGERTGVGLLIVQVIVQTYGGDVRIVRPGPGDTTFAISLPLATEDAILIAE